MSFVRLGFGSPRFMLACLLFACDLYRLSFFRLGCVSPGCWFACIRSPLFVFACLKFAWGLIRMCFVRLCVGSPEVRFACFARLCCGSPVVCLPGISLACLLLAWASRRQCLVSHVCLFAWCVVRLPFVRLSLVSLVFCSPGCGFAWVLLRMFCACCNDGNNLMGYKITGQERAESCPGLLSSFPFVCSPCCVFCGCLYSVASYNHTITKHKTENTIQNTTHNNTMANQRPGVQKTSETKPRRTTGKNNKTQANKNTCETTVKQNKTQANNRQANQCTSEQTKGETKHR